MAKGLDAGKTFLQGILAKITDPAQKAAAESLLGNADFVTAIGDGVAGQSEIDRQLQTLRTQKEELDARAADLTTQQEQLEAWHAGLTDWYTKHKDAIASGAQPRTPTPTPTPGKVPEGVVTTEQFTEAMRNTQSAFLGFERDRQRITAEHFKKFGEIVDLEPLLVHPKIGELGLTGVYEQVHKDRLEQWKTADDKRKEDAIRLDERQKVTAAQAQMPYPTPTGAGSGSPLDALTPAGPGPVVDAAVQEYNRLQAERAGATR